MGSDTYADHATPVSTGVKYSDNSIGEFTYSWESPEVTDVEAREYHFGTLMPLDPDEQLLFEAEWEFDFRFSDSLTGYFRPRVFVDALDSDLKRFEPYELYATWEEEGWDLRAGQMVENWGIVDTYNPIDVVSRRDFATDILDPDRLGELGVRFRLLFDGGETIGEPTVSFYALPVFRETLFPPEDQRFGFGTDAVPFEAEPLCQPARGLR